MKMLAALAFAAGLLLIPLAVNAENGKETKEVPPVAQTLVREGDFAVKLVETLKVGKTDSEEQAESMLTSLGIAPLNGWIADYPVTPAVIAELKDSIGKAADGGKLQMGRDEAVRALYDLSASLGLPVEVAEEGEPADYEAEQDYADYATPTVINNYYYEEGPPAVSYYSPPWDYYYLYSWVPSPFWCYGYYFPGFYILRDFTVVVIVDRTTGTTVVERDVGTRVEVRDGMRKTVSNHVTDPVTREVRRVEPREARDAVAGTSGFRPRDGTRGAVVEDSRGARRIGSGESGRVESAKGMESIYKRSLEREGAAGTAGRTREGVGASFSGEGREAVRGSSGIERRGGRTETAPSFGERGSRETVERERGVEVFRGSGRAAERQTGLDARGAERRADPAPTMGGSRSFEQPRDAGRSSDRPARVDRSFDPAPSMRGSRSFDTPRAGRSFEQPARVERSFDRPSFSPPARVEAPSMRGFDGGGRAPAVRGGGGGERQFPGGGGGSRGGGGGGRGGGGGGCRGGKC